MGDISFNNLFLQGMSFGYCNPDTWPEEAWDAIAHSVFTECGHVSGYLWGMFRDIVTAGASAGAYMAWDDMGVLEPPDVERDWPE